MNGMKLRLKGEAFSKPELTVFDSNNVTVAELKARVGEILQVQDEEFLRTLQLSMNGKVALATQGHEILTSLGFVSGDVVYILGRPSEGRTPKCPKLNLAENQDSKEEEGKSASVEQKDQTLILHETENMDLENNHDESGAQANLNVEGHHHVPLSDTPDSSIPVSYTNLISAYPSLLQSSLEKLASLIHILMVETGFVPQTSSISSNPFNTLPELWSVKHGTLKLNYKTGSQTPCTILLVAVGPIVNVQVTIGPGKLLSHKLKLHDYIPPVGGKNMRTFSVGFKNEIAFPLYVMIEREVNGICPTHFSNLPPEISYNILRRLDFKSLCLLSTTSRLFQNLANQPRLWKRLVIRDLGQKFATADTSDWKKLYKDELTLSRKQKEISKRIYQTMPCVPPPFLPSPRNYPGGLNGPEFPGLIGGYSDLYPDLRGFGPPSRRVPFQGIGDMGMGGFEFGRPPRGSRGGIGGFFPPM